MRIHAGAALLFATLAGLVASWRRGRYILCTEGGDRIYTVEEPARAECLAVVGERLSFVGARDQLPRFSRLWKRRLLLPPATVLPALTDAHAHLLEYGESTTAVDLRGTTSVQHAVRRVVDYVQAGNATSNGLIFGLGWDQTDWPDKAFPKASDMDVPALHGREIMMKRVDFHAVWCSPALLTRLQPLPQEIKGGEIVRDDRGHATGVFLDAAMDYVVARLPPWTDEQRQRFLDVASRDLLSVGIAGVHDAAISMETHAFYRRLDQSRMLPPLRIYGLLDCLNNTFCGEQVERYDGEHYTLRAAKVFADGALGSWGAAMWQPYDDLPSSRGILRSPVEVFKPLVQRWVDKGIQVAAHAIGDRANTVVVDAFESALSRRSSPERQRLRIEHAQIVQEDDLRRMAKLGVIASMQPTHCTSDMRYAEARVGAKRIKDAYAWQSTLKAGVRLSLSSDFPVEPISPFRGIYAAVTRLDPDTHTSSHGREGWYASERLTRQQALAGFTIDAAYAAFAEREFGSLRVGKRADFIIIDRDIMAVEPAEAILETKVLATVVNGKLVVGSI